MKKWTPTKTHIIHKHSHNDCSKQKGNIIVFPHFIQTFVVNASCLSKFIEVIVAISKNWITYVEKLNANVCTEVEICARIHANYLAKYDYATATTATTAKRLLPSPSQITAHSKKYGIFQHYCVFLLLFLPSAVFIYQTLNSLISTPFGPESWFHTRHSSNCI